MVIMPKLGLQKLRNADLVIYAGKIVEKISAIPAFSEVSPSVAAVNSKRILTKMPRFLQIPG